MILIFKKPKHLVLFLLSDDFFMMGVFKNSTVLNASHTNHYTYIYDFFFFVRSTHKDLPYHCAQKLYKS